MFDFRLSRIRRLAKYGLAAPVLAPLVRFTSLLDGAGEPPAIINFAGGGDFHSIGKIQTDILIDRAGLTANDRVLDVGCGIGRISLRLADRFPDLRYSGFDIVLFGIHWTRKKLKGKPNFRLLHANVHNSFYNPFGRVRANKYTFPYSDSSHDVVFATSVFTHLLESSARTYFSEAARVLASGNRLYFTTFLTDGALGPSPSFRFKHSIGQSFVASSTEPELAVAYPLSFWSELAECNGLEQVAVFPGSWRNAGECRDFQDAILFTKPFRHNDEHNPNPKETTIPREGTKKRQCLDILLAHPDGISAEQIATIMGTGNSPGSVRSLIDPDLRRIHNIDIPCRNGLYIVQTRLVL